MNLQELLKSFEGKKSSGGFNDVKFFSLKDDGDKANCKNITSLCIFVSFDLAFPLLIISKVCCDKSPYLPNITCKSFI